MNAGRKPDGRSDLAASAAAPGNSLPPKDRDRERVKEQVSGIWDYARDSAESAFSTQQHAAATGLQDFASALRNAGDQLAQQQKQSGADLARRAADTLEHVSATLHGKDLRGMAGDMERFARNQPVAFIGTAVALGFLGMRFIKSSSRDSQASALRAANPGLEARNLH
jgi:hypothetical protein